MRKLLKVLDEQGYTFLESIFQLTVLSIFLHLFVLFFFWKEPIEEKYFDTSSTEWELFSLDMQKLLSDVSEIQILYEGTTFRIVTSLGRINIGQSGTVIRKLVHGEGHVPLITNVQSVGFEFDGMTLTAHVKMLNGSVKVRGFAVGVYSE
jgi:competence protein ComGF